MAGRSQSFLFDRIEQPPPAVFERIDDLCLRWNFAPALAQALAWPPELEAVVNEGSPIELGFERDEHYGPRGDIVKTTTRTDLQRFISRALDSSVADAGVSVDYVWRGQGEKFPQYAKSHDGGPSWSLWPDTGRCSGVTLTFFVAARGLAAEPRLHAFVETLACEAAAALGSKRHLAVDDTYYVTIDHYRGAHIDVPFTR